MSIIILSWKNPESVDNLIDNIKGTEEVVKEFIIVYNGPKAGSPSRHQIRCNPSVGFKYIKNQKNLGYAPAINQAAELSTSDYLLLINDDALIKEDHIDRLIQLFEELTNAGHNIGVIGPTIVDNYDNPLFYGWRLNYKIGDIDPITQKLNNFKKDLMEVDYAIGAIFLTPRDLFERFDGFRSKLFGYWEESEYCIRLKERGYKILIATSLVGYHQGALSMDNYSSFKFYLYFRNRFWVFAFLHRDKIILPFFLLNFSFQFINKSIRMLKRGDFSRENINIIPLTLIDSIINFNRPLTYTIKKLQSL